MNRLNTQKHSRLQTNPIRVLLSCRHCGEQRIKRRRGIESTLEACDNETLTDDPKRSLLDIGCLISIHFAR